VRARPAMQPGAFAVVVLAHASPVRSVLFAGFLMRRAKLAASLRRSSRVGVFHGAASHGISIVWWMVSIEMVLFLA